MIIAQSSLTYAYKGESILRSAGISVKIVRLSAEKTQRGCGYGLFVRDHELSKALMLLRRSGAFIGEILQQ